MAARSETGGSQWDLDAVLTAWEEQRPGGDATREHRLIRAVLVDAIGALQRAAKRGHPNSANAKEARRWILNDANYYPGFSFVQVCEVLGLNKGWLRNALRLQKLLPSLSGVVVAGEEPTDAKGAA